MGNAYLKKGVRFENQRAEHEAGLHETGMEVRVGESCSVLNRPKSAAWTTLAGPKELKVPSALASPRGTRESFAPGPISSRLLPDMKYEPPPSRET